jgi:transcriptional regulator with XRE-family HTH domain
MARGMTQQELARRLHVQPSTVHGWESGKFRPEPERIKSLADELRIEPLRVTELLDVEQ